jgi:hypothetical protein
LISETYFSANNLTMFFAPILRGRRSYLEF